MAGLLYQDPDKDRQAPNNAGVLNAPNGNSDSGMPSPGQQDIQGFEGTGDFGGFGTAASKAGRVGVGLLGSAVGGKYGGYGFKAVYDGMQVGIQTGDWSAGAAASAKSGVQSALGVLSRATGLPLAQVVGIAMEASRGVSMGKGLAEAVGDAVANAGLSVLGSAVGSLLGPLGALVGGIAGGMLSSSDMVSEGILGDMMDTRDFEDIRDKYESMALTKEDTQRLDTAVRALDPSSGWEAEAMKKLSGEIMGQSEAKAAKDAEYGSTGGFENLGIGNPGSYGGKNDRGESNKDTSEGGFQGLGMGNPGSYGGSNRGPGGLGSRGPGGNGPGGSGNGGNGGGVSGSGGDHESSPGGRGGV